MASRTRERARGGRRLLGSRKLSTGTRGVGETSLLTDGNEAEGFDHIVFDTAPAGHTLLLLDATGAHHCDIVRQLGPSGWHFRTPMMQLQDPKQTRVVLVTLAETTPVLEAAPLQSGLRRVGIEPWAWVINRSLAMARPSSPLLRQRVPAEVTQIDVVRNQHVAQLAVIPLLAEEPIGAQRLQRLIDCSPALAGAH